jgi:hypothetical protein
MVRGFSIELVSIVKNRMLNTFQFYITKLMFKLFNFFSKKMKKNCWEKRLQRRSVNRRKICKQRKGGNFDFIRLVQS